MYRSLVIVSLLSLLVDVTGIPFQDENNGKFILGTNNIMDNERSKPENDSTNHQDVAMTGINITQLCSFFLVAPENCSCDVFTILSGSHLQDLCKVIKEIDEPKTNLVYDPTLSQTYGTASILASLFGALGNGAIIILSYRNWGSLSNKKLVIFFLSTFHFIFGLLQFVQSVPMFWTNAWLYGSGMCKFLNGTETLGPVLSMGFILIIAVERYYKMFYGFEREISSSTFYILSGVNVVIGLILIAPFTVALNIDQSLAKCNPLWPGGSKDSLKYNISLLVISIIVPAFVIIFVYIQLLIHSKKETNSYTMRDTITEKERKEKEENKHVPTIIIVTLIALIMCVLPNRIVWIYLDLNNRIVLKNVYKMLWYIALVPFPFYVALNPIIYCIVDEKWKRDIFNTLTCKEMVSTGVRPSTFGYDDKASPRSLKRSNERSQMLGQINKYKPYGGMTTERSNK